MTNLSLEHDVKQVCALIQNNMQAASLTVIGIAGPPASGKSTLAASVVQTLNKTHDQEHETTVPMAALLPMDGYHLDNALLQARDLLARKGAPETFDAAGFCAAIQQLSSLQRISYYPRFDRHLDLAIANAIAIYPETRVVVVEGNYLLLKSAPWSSLRSAFAATVFVCPSKADLQNRLQQRWIQHGLTPEAALQRATENDLPNAELVMQHSHEADLWLTQQDDSV